MNLITRPQIILVLAASLSLCLFNLSARGQSNTPDTPIQPLPPDTINSRQATEPGPSTQGAESSNQPQPDTHVLSSGEIFGLGSLRSLRRVFDPSLQFSQSGQTGLVAGRVLGVSSLGGSLDLARNWRRYHMAVAYSGAETVYHPSYLGIRHLPYHHFGLSQDIFLSRWILRLHDDLQYSWSTGFGGILTGGLPQVGQNSVLGNIQPSLVASQTIQTGLVRQLTNTAVGEADYSFSRRTTLTFLGSFNLVQFFQSGYIGSHDAHGRIGYNYALSAKNNIGLSYDHDRMSFVGTSSLVQTDLLQVAFGRKLTGRLAFQVAAGPEILRLHDLGSSSSQQLSWSAFSAMNYSLSHNHYSLLYSHAATGGSGVFLGSNTDTITAGVTHDFARFWSVSVNGGYAVNRNLAPVATFASRFDNRFGGAVVNRELGRQVRLALSYEFQQQSGGAGSCPVPSCGLASSFNQLAVNLQWHPVGPAR
jgi:hypothetical protein